MNYDEETVLAMEAKIEKLEKLVADTLDERDLARDQYAAWRKQRASLLEQQKEARFSMNLLTTALAFYGYNILPAKESVLKQPLSVPDMGALAREALERLGRSP